MDIGFDNIDEHIISMDNFPLKWRFTEEKYDLLPELHLNQLKPLDIKAARFLWTHIADVHLHDNVPFKKGFFKTIDKALITEGNEEEIRKWLYHRGLPFDKEVCLSWGQDTAMIVPWKLLIKYFDAFYYTCSDDLTVIDESLDWALLFYHVDEIYFGTNRPFRSDVKLPDVNFLC